MGGTTQTRVASVAGEPNKHGSPVRRNGGRCFLELDLTRIDGITCRPHQANAATRHEKGEALEIQTDGGIMAELGRHPRFVELRGGKVLDA